MVEYLSQIRPNLFGKRVVNIADSTALTKPRTASTIASNLAGNPFRDGPDARRDAAGLRRGPFAGSVELSDGARQALLGSEKALELARDFNAARLGRPARRRLGQFFRGFSKELGASERNIEQTARRIARLTEDLDRRFGDLAERVLGRLDAGRLGGGLGGSVGTTAFSLSQVSFSLQVDTTIFSILEDGETSTLRLDQVQLSLQAVQVEGSVSVRERVGYAPETPLFELRDGETLTDIADRLIKIFGTKSISTQVSAQQVELDLSTTVFTAQGVAQGSGQGSGQGSALAGSAEGAAADEPDTDGGVSVDA